MKRYTIAQLEAFLAVVESGSFRVAAERLGVTQPSISLRIRELESALGTGLLERGKGGVRCTEAGLLARQYAERSIEVLDEMERRLSSGDPLSGSLRLGASNTFALSCLPALLRTLEARHPRLRVELTISNSSTLRSLLDAQQLDIAFLVDALAGPHFVVEPLAACDIAWFSRRGMLDPQQPLTPREARDHRIVTMPAPSPIHAVISQWFAHAHVPLPTLDICNDMATLVRLVKLGVAIAVVPACLLADELSSGEVERHHAVPTLAQWTIYAASHIGARGRANEIIIEIARAVIADSPLAPAPATRVILPSATARR
ncbi:LysR family transcriptional regulator [Chitinasiproducens palmae]|uniref:DNA-binding transcriptional regulator, LysR family n=1 Tax=Chitinasiproducens palmae TaxID=1770053 RepID=A0A1H2PK84_9BURK|nr:LysR family transcriptional regulator [Chitinasiproducens palmae]SDV46707.1 DNA-binding transcriptional regulator, LysR family [Chitinasiproducens palmae]